jgi:hypothetical protein
MSTVRIAVRAARRVVPALASRGCRRSRHPQPGRDPEASDPTPAPDQDRGSRAGSTTHTLPADSARLTTAALVRVSARITSGSVRTAFRAGVDWYRPGSTRQTALVRRSRRCPSAADRLSIRLAGAQEVGSVSGVNALVSAGPRMRSELFGGHDPQLADGGVAGAGTSVCSQRGRSSRCGPWACCASPARSPRHPTRRHRRARATG